MLKTDLNLKSMEKWKRYRLPRNECICVYCDLNDIDDELHRLLKCSCLNNLRYTISPRYYFNIISMFKLIELLVRKNEYFRSFIFHRCCYIFRR